MEIPSTSIDNKQGGSHLWAVIMAGGLGSRFWPISRVDCPKQFIDVMGVGSTMLQLTYARALTFCPKEHVLVVSIEHYADRVREQLPGLEPWQLLCEPLRRNTAPCIALAAAAIARRDPEATVVVCPSDHAIFNERCFLADMAQAAEAAGGHDWIVTFGAQPTRPDTSYGYIQFRAEPSLPGIDSLHSAVTFTEKPPMEMARQFMSSGEFYWNTGILVARLSTLTDALRTHLPAVAEALLTVDDSVGRDELAARYATCDSISIDHGVMEKAGNVQVLEASFGWSDVETWDSLYDVSARDAQGNAMLGSDNVFLYNTRDCIVAMPGNRDRTIVLEGLDGYIVAASDDALMVCRRSSEDLIFKFANDVELKKMIDHK